MGVNISYAMYYTVKSARRSKMLIGRKKLYEEKVKELKEKKAENEIVEIKEKTELVIYRNKL